MSKNSYDMEDKMKDYGERNSGKTGNKSQNSSKNSSGYDGKDCGKGSKDCRGN